MAKNAKKKDPRDNPAKVINALTRLDRKTSNIFRNELDRLCGVSAPRDTRAIAQLEKEAIENRAQIEQFHCDRHEFEKTIAALRSELIVEGNEAADRLTESERVARELKKAQAEIATLKAQLNQ